jgi:uncharacterized protein
MEKPVNASQTVHETVDQPCRDAHLTRMDDTPPDSLIPYDEIVQEALRAVVGRVLGQVEAAGGELPGAHHFYITFKTGAPGVVIPDHLKERFPDEMTIVLQNKFWDLSVSEAGFAVGLSFNQRQASLEIPFSAITAFQFQAVTGDISHEAHDDAENDATDNSGPESADESGDGSNVVTVDFGKKK